MPSKVQLYLSVHPVVERATTMSEKVFEATTTRRPAALAAVRPSSGLLSLTEWQISIASAALALLFALLFPASFATHHTLLNMLRVGGILLTVSIGQSFALMVGGFDISVGATMGLASVIASALMAGGVSVPLGIAAGILAGVSVGLVNGLIIALMRVTPFVMTLGMLTAISGLADYIANGGTISGLPDGLGEFGRRNWFGCPSALWIALIVLVIAWLIQQRCRAGLYIFAIGGSREAAQIAGVPVALYEVLAYALCAGLAAVAGVMLTARIGIGQGSLGQGYDLLSIATAVIGGVAVGGGVGRLTGVVLGVTLITLLTTGLDIAGVNPFIQKIITGAVLVAAVLIARLRSLGGLTRRP
jgi:ribose/xylose/arabinose/galactoside ABC-type transport system permease subunit